MDRTSAAQADAVIKRIKRVQQLRQSSFLKYFRKGKHLRLIEEERDLQAILDRLYNRPPDPPAA